MPKLQKLHCSSTKLNPGSGNRRMSNSRSTGDLLGLLKRELNFEKKLPSFVPRPPEKNVFSSTDDMVVCGFLYRLTTTGIWFRLWIELRFNYLMGFYCQTDSLPVDVINLEGYAVNKATECDHLDHLYPIKVYKKGEKDLFFYTESEESRMEWMTNLKKTAQQEISSVNIQGLNLELDLANKKTVANRANENGRRNSTVVRNISNKNINDMTILEEDSDNLMKFDLKSVDEVRNKYERAEAVTQHEALRLATYYWQRRVSTQIKVSTLEDIMGEQSSKILQKQLEGLQIRLNDIENQREQSEKAVEQALFQLESKKAQELGSLHAPLDASLGKETETKVKVIKESQKTIIEEPSTLTRRCKTSSNPLNRHSFSPGDRKCGSVSDFYDVIDTPLPKRPSPLKLLSNAMRSHSKRDRKDLPSPSQLPPSPMNFEPTDENVVCRSDGEVGEDRSVLKSECESQCEPQSPCLPSPVPKLSKRIRRFFSFNAKSSKSWSPS